MKQVRMIVNVQMVASAIYGFLIACTDDATLAESAAGVLLVNCAMVVYLEHLAGKNEVKNKSKK